MSAVLLGAAERLAREIGLVKEHPAELASELKDALYLIPRGETPRAIAASGPARRRFADPAFRAAWAEKRKLMCADPNARSCARNRPRAHGKWLPDPKPYLPLSVRLKQQRDHEAAKQARYSAAARARFENPVFREKALAQLALARTRINRNRRRRTNGQWEVSSP